MNAWLVRAVASALGGKRHSRDSTDKTSAAGSAERRKPNQEKRCRHSRHQNRLQPQSRSSAALCTSLPPTATTPWSQVRPRDPNRASDVRVAEGARVDFRNGTLDRLGGQTIHLPRPRRRGAVDIELPSRSRLQVSSASAKLRAEGEFGDCRFATASGDATVGLGRREHQGGQRLWRLTVRASDGRQRPL